MAAVVAPRTKRWRRRLSYAAGTLVALFGLLFLAARRSDIPLENLKQRWAPPPSRFVDVDGMSVHYRDEGSGPAVVLVHGTSSSLHTWDGWAKALASDHRVVRLDLPGFGLTGPNQSGDYGLEAYAAFLEHFVARVGLSRFALAGNSLGGGIAWTYALSHPERVTKLVLVDALGYAVRGPGTPLAFRIAKWPIIPGLLSSIDPRPLVEEGVKRSYGDASRIRPGVIDRYYELSLRAGNRRAFVDRMRSVFPDGSRIRGLRVRTLVLWGALDRLIPLEAASRFERDIAGAELIVYDDLGHIPMEEDPARTVADVRRFLDD